jgi:hypothetical protein
MRIAYLLFLVPIVFSGGCADKIARVGTVLSEFKTKEEMYAKFGEPCASGTTDGAFKEGQFIPRDAAFYEDYTTRQKISTPYLEPGYGMMLCMTLGTIELLLVPEQLYLIMKRKLVGQTLRVIYDANGKVVGAQLDGEDINFHP